MNKKFNFSISDYRRKLQSSVLLLFLGCFAYVFVPYIVADVNAATQEVISTVTWTPISLSLSDGGAVSFGTITPSSTSGGNVGTMKVLKKNIAVTSNGTNVNVYLSMVGNSSKLEYTYDGTTTDSSISIPAVTEEEASPAEFSGSSWGYAVRAKGAGEKVDPVSDMGFSAAATYGAYDSKIGQELTKATDSTIYKTGTWKGVPAFGAPDIVWSATTNNPHGFGGSEGDGTLNNFDIYYAAMVGTDVIAGTYQNSVVYTALASSTEIDGVSNNINVSNLSSGGKFAANGDKIRLEFDLAQSESGAVSRDKVHIYLLPHDLMVSKGYTLTDEIRTAAAGGNTYPTCTIGNASGDFVITGDGTTGAAINCVVSGATIADAKETETQGTYTDDLDGDGYKDGYYDVWVYINNGFELDYVSKYMVSGGGSAETLAFVGLQSQKIKSTNDGVEPVITEMQDMTTGICHSTNKWDTGVGNKARVYDPTGTTKLADGDNNATTLAANTEVGVGTFRLKDNRDNKDYLVRHLADGNCWMVQNLDLELADAGTAYTMTKDNTDLNTKVSYDPGATIGAMTGTNVKEKLQKVYGSISTCDYQFQPRDTNGGTCRWGSGLSQNSTTNDGGTTYEFDTGALAHKIDGTVENSDSTNWRPKNRSFLPDGTRNNSAEPVSGSKVEGNDNTDWVENNGNAEYPRSYDHEGDWIQNDIDGYDDETVVSTHKNVATFSATAPASGDNAETQYMGDYYNWYAATAESGKFADINTSSQAADSICPKGWQLPANHTADSTKSWQNLANVYAGGNSLTVNSTAGSKMLRSAPLSVIFSGLYYWVNGNLNVRGSCGYYWSSTPYSNYYNSYNLYFTSTGVNPQSSSNKPDGFTVRCVAR